jgi:hypothetical protein
MHALECVGTEHKGGRGKKGGLTEYAKRVGKTQPYVTELVQAATVAKAIAQAMGLDGLLDKSKHLSEIHALPAELWQEAVAHMLAKQWTVKEVSEALSIQRSPAADDRKKVAQMPPLSKHSVPGTHPLSIPPSTPRTDPGLPGRLASAGGFAYMPARRCMSH